MTQVVLLSPMEFWYGTLIFPIHDINSSMKLHGTSKLEKQSSMETHGALGATVIGNLNVAQSSMELFEIWFSNFDDNSIPFVV